VRLDTGDERLEPRCSDADGSDRKTLGLSDCWLSENADRDLPIKASSDNVPTIIMNELTAFVTGGVLTLFGSLVTGWFTYRAAARERELERYKRQLIQAYKDVAAFHRLEERYTNALETPDRSAEAWKREIRRQQADEQFGTPSEDATWRKCEQRVSDLG
jgi:hypothetical protein